MLHISSERENISDLKITHMVCDSCW